MPTLSMSPPIALQLYYDVVTSDHLWCAKKTAPKPPACSAQLVARAGIRDEGRRESAWRRHGGRRETRGRSAHGRGLARRGGGLEPVFVMKAAENRRGDDTVAVANPVAGLHWRRQGHPECLGRGSCADARDCSALPTGRGLAGGDSRLAESSSPDTRRGSDRSRVV